MPASNAAPVGQTDLMQTAAAGVVAALVIAALYLGRPLLVPFALAVLLAFALARPAEFLRRLGLPRTLSVIITVLIAVLFLAGFGAFIGMQFGRLAAELPHYQSNLTNKIESVRGAATGNTIVESASALFQNLDNAIAQKPRPPFQNAAVSNAQPAPKGPRPIPVEIRQPDLAPFEVIESIVNPLLEPMATLALAIVFVVFILLQKEDLRSRFISLVGSRDLQRTSLAIDDGAQRLSGYLLLQTTVNACVGLIMAVGLWIIGVPNPALWGLIAAIFRFVPYVGIPAAAALPLALALAVDPGWTMVVLTAVLYFGTEAIAGQAVEPWLYGRNMGLSPIAILLAAAFWTWVWGPIGLLLSTPLTMCVVVLGRHVETLRFLDTLLGNRPALSEEENFYLRIMKGNPDELAHQAELFLKENTIEDYFDNVAVKGLVLAQREINRGAPSASDNKEKILQTVEGLIENIRDTHPGAVSAAAPSNQTDEGSPSNERHDAVLCIAGRGPLDGAAALLLKELLDRQGIGLNMISSEDASQTNLNAVEIAQTRLVCLSYLAPDDPANARYLVRRLRKRMPHLPIIAGFWGAMQNDTQILDWIEATGSDFVLCNLGTAVTQIVALSRKPAVISSGSVPFQAEMDDMLQIAG